VRSEPEKKGKIIGKFEIMTYIEQV